MGSDATALGSSGGALKCSSDDGFWSNRTHNRSSVSSADRVPSRAFDQPLLKSHGTESPALISKQVARPLASMKVSWLVPVPSCQ